LHEPFVATSHRLVVEAKKRQWGGCGRFSVAGLGV